MSENLVAYLHNDAGVSTLAGKCKCKLCVAVDQEEEEVIRGASQGVINPDELERVVCIDLSKMWTEQTQNRIESDSRLRALVLCMIRASGDNEGAAAASSLRQLYGHYLDGTMESDFCADLAFFLGELYCVSTIHVPHQYAEDLYFWPRAYLAAIQASNISLPHAVTNATLARAYGAIMACGSHYPDQNAQQKDLAEFTTQWVAARYHYNRIFGHLAFLVLPCRVYGIFDELCTSMTKEFKALEEKILVMQQTKEAEELISLQQATDQVDPLEEEIRVMEENKQ